MGNQMFQIAATVALALRNGAQYAIPAQSLKPSLWPRYFDFPRRIAEVKQVWHEESHAYHPIAYKNGICLDGYFQSEKYFSDCRSEIIEAFGLEYSLWRGVAGVHVRRGDYLGLQEKHPPVTVEYIREAMERLLRMNSNDGLQFLFFSDDIEWCKVNFPGHRYSEGCDEKTDLIKMSCCEHNIIANSSFSWWGAWLNQNPDKIVIAPKVWFGPKNAHLDTKDLIPEGWIKI